jgi:hypothetical protein
MNRDYFRKRKNPTNFIFLPLNTKTFSSLYVVNIVERMIHHVIFQVFGKVVFNR